jgi:hypothetical protein
MDVNGSKVVLVTGDRAIYLPQFGAATVQVRPGILAGSASTFKIGGQAACLQGDEASVAVPGCLYVTPTYPIAGVGTVSVARLGPDQRAAGIRVKGMAFLVGGDRFVARFDVKRPATVLLPNGSSVPDPRPSYTGQGYFEHRDWAAGSGLRIVIKGAVPTFRVLP